VSEGSRFSIYQVSTADKDGGAEAVAFNLFQSYRERGHVSVLAVGTKRTPDDGIVVIDNDRCRGNWARLCVGLANRMDPQRQRSGTRKFLRQLISYPIGQPARWFRIMNGHEDFDYPATRHLLDLLPTHPDILHCHNLHGGYFDLRALPWLSRRLPVVLTLHDAWLSSGHCAHSPSECEQWKTGCAKCSHISLPRRILTDGSAFNWRVKQGILLRSRLFVVTPSRWLLERMRDSILAPSIIGCRVIPNGVDLRIFQPGDRSQARSSVGFRDEERVILFVAHGIRENPWKDYPMLRSAVEALVRMEGGRKVRLVGLGESHGIESFGKDIMLQFVPYQTDEHVVAQYYRAADIYVHPSRIDTFPNTVLEAMACGIPVVASRVGGIAEQVDEGVTGFLVESGNGPQMAERLTCLLENHSLRRSMGKEGEARVRALFDINMQTRAYLDLYETLISHRMARSEICLSDDPDDRPRGTESPSVPAWSSKLLNAKGASTPTTKRKTSNN
jgi:glycosyltransferase involved in cell wall biosynthesis